MSGPTVVSEPEGTVRRQRVFQWWDYPLFIVMSGLSLAAIGQFFAYWVSFPDWRSFPATFAITTLMLVAIVVNHQGRWYLLWFMTRPLPMEARPGWRVAVATTFVPGAEPLEMLEDTLRALVELDYPHDTWVLDEGDRDEVKALCQALGVQHFSRKPFAHYQTAGGTFRSRSKHGNYNAWLHEIGFDRYQIIAAIDPDHVPDRAFLSSVLGYFSDPGIGYVQAPQAYYNQGASFISRGAAEESYGFYSYVQMAYDGLGSPAVIGCHNTHRMAALRQVGGFAPHDADDLLITLAYRSAGWRGVYVPRILGRGLTPVNWSGYLTQQRRWARSLLDVKLRIYPKVAGRLSLAARLVNAAHGLNYLQTSVLIAMSLVLVTVALASGTMPTAFSGTSLAALALLGAVLQLGELYRQRFYLDWRREWGIHWRVAILQIAKWPYLLLACWDVLAGGRVPYALTEKVRPGGRQRMLLWPNAGVAIAICAAVIIGLASGRLNSPGLLLFSGIIVLTGLALIATEYRDFPAPYDRKLSARQ